MIKITKASEALPVSQIVVVVYGQPAIGKTSLGFTATDALLLDFDKGGYRSANRGDSIQIAGWGDIDRIEPADLATYKTIVIDTAGRALDVLTTDIIRKNPKAKGSGGALSLQGYGTLKASFVGWLNQMRGFGLDIVLLAHSDEQRSGDEILERLDVQGGSKSEIYKCADAMARMKMNSGKRELNFNPSDTAFGKNPAQLPVMQVPNFATNPHFLGEIIDKIKSTLNAGSDAAMREKSKMEDYRTRFDDFCDPPEFTEEAKELADADPKVKALLIKIAADKGISFDKGSKTFVLREAA